MRVAGLLFVSFLVLPGVASAARPSRAAAARPRAQAPTSAIDHALSQGMDPRFLNRIVSEGMRMRLDQVRGLARIFEKITQKRDYSDEHVVFANNHVTAFLAITDPQHPKFDPETPEEPDEDGDERTIPADKLTHILVVPNVKREHIGRTLLSRLTRKDLQESEAVMAEAEALAARLGIKNAKIYANPAHGVAIGYYHVHIVGERTQPHPHLP